MLTSPLTCHLLTRLRIDQNGYDNKSETTTIGVNNAYAIFKVVGNVRNSKYYICTQQNTSHVLHEYYLFHCIRLSQMINSNQFEL